MRGVGGRREIASRTHRSAQVWAVAALLAVLLPHEVRLGWWLPLHLALAGAASQLIVGGQLQFSSALAMGRPMHPFGPTVRLGLLNAGAVLIVVGRVTASPDVLVAGAVLFAGACLWAAVVVERIWRGSLAPRFGATRTSYLLANVSILGGAALGAALGAGAFPAGRLAHLSLNLLGWGGLTILGTVITFLPTVLHVRVPHTAAITTMPWITFGGLGMIAAGLALDARILAVAGAVVLLAGLSVFGRFVVEVARGPRARPIPVAARHLMAGLAWFGVVALVQIPLLARGDVGALRDLWVVGLGGGLIVQAILGSWAFLLPMARSTAPAEKGRELVAFELGAKTQVAVYNAGLVLVLLALRGFVPGRAGAAGVALVWGAAAWAVMKTLLFPWLAGSSRIRRAAARWWAPRARAKASVRTGGVR